MLENQENDQINFMFSVILDKYILRPPLLYPAASVQCYLCPKEFILLLLLQLSGATHTHTCLPRQMVYRALLCPCVWILCSWSAVGSPLITLIWLCKLAGSTFLFNQAVVFLLSHRAEWTLILSGKSTESTHWNTPTPRAAFWLHTNFWLPR